jgi:serine/threonine-protein kinase RsbW
VNRTAPQATTSYTGVFCGRPEQVGHARHAITRHLAGHPAAADAALIISELAANAVLHSNSAGQSFTVRARTDDTSLHLEVEDLGGPWHPAPRDTSRPHGLDVIQALTGAGNWGINGDSTGRTAWARLPW